MMKTLITLALLCLHFSAWAADIQAGQEKATQVCQSCHGLDGQGIDSTYPKLAGQFPDYLAKALNDYRSGARSNAIMAGFAATLTDQDIENLAAYYGSLSEGALQILTVKH